MFNEEFPTLMRFCLLHFLHPWKSHAQNGRSDSTPRILTFTFLSYFLPLFVLFLGLVSLFLSKCFLDVNKIRKAAYSILEAVVWHKVVLFWNWKKASCLCAAQSTELAKVYCIATEFRLSKSEISESKVQLRIQGVKVGQLINASGDGTYMQKIWVWIPCYCGTHSVDGG